MKKTKKIKTIRKNSKKYEPLVQQPVQKPLADIFPAGLSPEDIGRMIDTAIGLVQMNFANAQLNQRIQEQRCLCCGAPLDENQLAREQKQIQDTIDNSSLDKTRKPNYALDYYKDSLKQR